VDELKHRVRGIALPLLLLLFAGVAYGPALSLPFVGDDYVFLDKTRDASFTALWSFRNVDFGWYRPWSRELHFWALQRLFGPNETAFRLFGVVLWIVALGLYAAVVRRVASSRVAAIATLGVASLALWGTPLLWVSGSQDLWMLCFAMASVLLFLSGRIVWTLMPFALALLSKETAAVLPALLCGYALVLERRSLKETLRRTAPLWAVLIVWLAVHPALRARLLSGPRVTLETEHRPPGSIILARTLLSVVSLDTIPRPQDVDSGAVLRTLLSAVLLAIGVWLALRAPAAPGPTNPREGRRGLVRFAGVWMLAGWAPLLHASISWHAYYGCLGVLGAWVAIALWLERHPRLAVVAIASLTFLRGAQAATPAWDWGSEWYLRRAGNMLTAIRGDLLRQHPTLPQHSRVYLGHIPNNIGLIAGQSPALRVWYRDSTLQAGFFSYYRPRREGEPQGQDFFFRFDSLTGMTEIHAGAEDVPSAVQSDPSWEDAHEKLAMLFLRSGDVRRAAVEFEKLSQLPPRADAAGYAAVCWEVAGDTARADSLAAGSGKRMGLSTSQLSAWLAQLRQSFPQPKSATEP
jgi:hypothetical protein